MAVVLITISILGTWLVTKPRFKDGAILLLLCCLGSVVLLLHFDHYFRTDFYPTPIFVESLIRAGLFLIAAIYFVFPTKLIKPLLILLPVMGGAWFLMDALLIPVSISFELAVLMFDGALPDNEEGEIPGRILDLHQHYFIKGCLGLSVVILYYAALYGHNLKWIYQLKNKITQRV